MMQPTLPVATTTAPVRSIFASSDHELRGDLRLQDVVAAGGPAAQMSLGDFAHLEPCLAQQAARQRVELWRCCIEQAESEATTGRSRRGRTGSGDCPSTSVISRDRPLNLAASAASPDGYAT